MSSEIEIRADGVGAAYVGRNPAWWGVGVKIPNGLDDATIEEVLDAIPEMAADVDLVPMQAVMPDGTVIPTDSYATVRRSFNRTLDNLDLTTGLPQIEEVLPKVLGVGLSERYRVMQNRRAMSIVDDLVKQAGARIASAGPLRDGAQAWVLVRLPKVVEIGGIDTEKVETYILVTNSFDGSLAIGIHIVRVRVVCANTLALALSGAVRSFKIRHTESLDDRLEEARKALEITWRYEEEFENAANALLAKPITDAEFDSFLESLVPSVGLTDKARINAENTQSIIRDVWNETPDIQPIKTSAWGAVQAVSDYADHRCYMNPEGRFRASMMGEKSLTQKAYDLLAV